MYFYYKNNKKIKVFLVGKTVRDHVLVAALVTPDWILKQEQVGYLETLPLS